MESITIAQDVAAIWFIVFFGAALLSPIWVAVAKWLWNMGRS